MPNTWLILAYVGYACLISNKLHALVSIPGEDEIDLKPKVLVVCEQSDGSTNEAIMIQSVEKIVGEEEGELVPIEASTVVQIQEISRSGTTITYANLEDLDQFRRFKNNRPYDEMRLHLFPQSAYRTNHTSSTTVRDEDIAQSLKISINYHNVASYSQPVFIPESVQVGRSNFNCSTGLMRPKVLVRTFD